MIEIIINYIVPITSMILLIFAASFFSSSETAVCSISKIQLRQMLSERQNGAKNIEKLKSDMDLFITTVLTGNNLINTLASSIAAAFAINVLGKNAVVYMTFILTICMIIFGEIIPKTLASLSSVKLATRNAASLLFIERVTFPVIWIFLQFTRFVSFVEKAIIPKTHPFVTEAELKALIELGQEEGTLEQNEKNMLYKIFEISDLCVKNIMRHRSFIKSVDEKCTYNQVIKVFSQTGYSRLPVYSKDTENIIGMLHYKSVLFNKDKRPEEVGFTRRCMSNVLFVPETLSAIELLQKFKSQHKNIAVAVNEHGTNSGIVTMDDILRVVLGRVSDEFGNLDIPAEQRISVINSKEVIVPGDMKIDDLNNILGLKMQSQNYDTIAGYLLEKFDNLPQTGEVLKQGKTLYIIEDQSQRRIQTVRIRL